MPPQIQNVSRVRSVRASDLTAFGDVTYRPGGQCGPRVQQDYQLVAMYSGQAHILIDEEERHLAAHYIALMRPGHREHFAFDADGDTHHTWCAVHPSLVDGPLREALAGAPFCLPITPRLHSLLEAGLRASAGDRGAAQGMLTQLGLTLLHAYAYEAEQAALRSLTPDAVTKAQHYIAVSLESPMALKDIARAASVTPQHLVRLFRRHLHTTPMRYVWDSRAARGAELLAQTGLTIGEVAERCGFQTAFHFSRVIRRRYGAPPRELRRRAWRVDAP